ncbi:MAG: helix-turn-helix transcriptional regulator [Nitrososphaerota archaeon]|nr:helix-turn-helix transcriptional regulator [Nitrososphaerota archaeon]MDG6959677.1 helix-turn-helix transcriptional regulator [Nitrososphaerota archaeon]MDG6965222.1 helix-turn-helix transcriptional regulator [Nitrososphaerota archaeon]MDG6968123.1 helix-turn-helix transcriptional regulator [Nitrososphaerota archaeon]MDG6968951.1 helix-turn-helix transcriptional regulator [Nitrososphaerota archaeon]
MRFAERLKGKVQKENLWFFVLILLSTEERYGFELRGLINEKFGFWSGNVTAYRVLYDLERSGMVKAEARDRRKYYRITELGRQEVREAKAFLQALLRE